MCSPGVTAANINKLKKKIYNCLYIYMIILKTACVENMHVTRSAWAAKGLLVFPAMVCQKFSEK